MSGSGLAPYAVRAVRCDHRAGEEEIYQSLVRATTPLRRSWERLQRAERIVIKLNMIKAPERVTYFAGRRRELVDDAVARAVFRLLRERTRAPLVAVDTYPYGNGHRVPEPFNYQHILRDFGVEFRDASLQPLRSYAVPGGGRMFRRYTLCDVFGPEVAMVSVAKLKNHAFMGITLTLKNLFGLPPMIPPLGRARQYYHHFIRLSYVLPDLGLLTAPCLNIVDGLTGQSGREWGGEGRVTDLLLAGDHPVATDACGTQLMGHDPTADWPQAPFHRDRNHLLAAAEDGFGTVDLARIDYQSEVPPAVGAFAADDTDSPATVASWRRTACEQALYYRDHQRELVGQYAGQFVFLQDGVVVWHGADPSHLGSRRELSGGRPDSALWLKYVDPDEQEGEHFERYEECLQRLSVSPSERS